MNTDNNPLNDENYLKALKQAQQFHPEPIGCTDYFGKTESDRNYPRQLNTLILLVLNLHGKVDYLTTLVQTQKTQEESSNTTSTLAADIEALSNQLKSLPVEQRPQSKVAKNIFGLKE